MEYTLKQLLEDKRLRAAVVKEKFEFQDGNGVVQCLDFENLPFLKNHRIFYDFLSENGGEALLSKLLEQGKTCLTDDPKAANNGVRKIKGTDKFFLMTNAGESKVLASILWGVQGYGETLENFDPELVRILVKDEENEEESEETVELENIDLELDEEEEEKRLPPHYNVSLIQKDGKYALYDNDENRFITMEYEDASDGVLSTMAVCEPLMAPPCREDQYNDMEEESVRLGWKYKLTEDGLWGWISEDCSIVQAPGYQKLEVHCDGHDYRREEMRLLAWDWASISCCDGWTPLKPVFSTIMDDLPEEGLSIENRWEWYLLTWNQEEHGIRGLVVYKNGKQTSRFNLSFREGVLKLWEGSDAPQSWMCGELTLDACETHFTYDCKEGIMSLNGGGIYLKPAEYEDLCLLHEGAPEGWRGKKMHYGVRRQDCYWGVVEANGNGVASKTCAPFAFTHVRALNREKGLAALEQFGKWGVYNVLQDKYIVPCDYESVSYDMWNDCIKVCRMNFKGEIRCDGTWKTHLRREEG